MTCHKCHRALLTCQGCNGRPNAHGLTCSKCNNTGTVCPVHDGYWRR
jgi:RNase P subunit RPR2